MHHISVDILIFVAHYVSIEFTIGETVNVPDQQLNASAVSITDEGIYLDL